MLRPAWAHSYGCKSRRMLITTSEVQLHEGDRVWEGCVEHKLGADEQEPDMGHCQAGRLG
jgi:hypothetical protein